MHLNIDFHSLHFIESTTAAQSPEVRTLCLKIPIRQAGSTYFLPAVTKEMKNLKLSLEQAMTVLEIPEEDQQKYLRLIG